MYSGSGVGGGGVGLRGGGVGVFGGDGGGLKTHKTLVKLKLKEVTDVGSFFGGGGLGAINFSIFGGVLG